MRILFYREKRFLFCFMSILILAFFINSTLVQALTFQDALEYPVGNAPNEITTGDFDGDGYADLATADASSDTISVLFNDGDGTFSARMTYIVGDFPMGITAGDFNGDGNIDLAVTNVNSNSVSILLNNGNVTFAARVDYAVGEGPVSISIGDYDGDDVADLAVSNANSDNVSILLNNGNGTFSAKVDYGVGDHPWGITTEDYDGDGNADLVTANYHSDNVSVLLNNGDGTFAAKVDYSVGTKPTSITTGDYDGDSDADLAVGNSLSNNVSILLNNEDGTFAAKMDYAVGVNPWGITTADYDRDGDADLAVGNFDLDNISILQNNGDATFVGSTLSVGDAPVSITTGDYNGDGVADLAVSNMYSNNVSILLNTTPALNYTVTYNGNGGTGTAPTESNKAEGANFTAATNTFVPPSGKKFKEWNTMADGNGTSYAIGETVTMPAGNLTLYATWKDKPKRTNSDDKLSSGSSMISDVMTTPDDKTLHLALVNTGKAGFMLKESNTAQFSGTVLKQLADNNMPFTVSKGDVKLTFAPGFLNTSGLTAQGLIEIGIREVSVEEKEAIQSGSLAVHSSGLFEIEGKIYDLTVYNKGNGSNPGEKIEKFGQPVAVTVDLSYLGNLSTEQIGRLTGVRLEKDTQGNLVPMRLGGTYDPVSRTVTFYTDKFSLYTVMINEWKTHISLIVDNSVASVNNKVIMLDVPPVMINNRTMVPVRFVAESLGAEVDWNQETQTVRILLDGEELRLVLGQVKPEEGLDNPAQLINNRTMVPLRYITERFGAEVNWQVETKTVEILVR